MSMKILSVLLLSSISLFGCNSDTKKNSLDDIAEDNKTLHLLTGTELLDSKVFIDEIKKETGVNIVVDEIGTVKGSKEIVFENKYDGFILPSSNHIKAMQGNKNLILEEVELFKDHVVLAVKKDYFDKNKLTHTNKKSKIIEKIKDKEFDFGMTDPMVAHSGFSVLTSLDQLLKTNKKEKLKNFFLSHKVITNNSRELSLSYLDNPDTLDGLFNYESSILKINEQVKDEKNKLIIIEPKNGSLVSKYPFGLLNKNKKEAYDKVAKYITSDMFKKWKSFHLTKHSISDEHVKELSFPIEPSKYHEITTSFFTTYKKPSTNIYLIDLDKGLEGKKSTVNNHHLKEVASFEVIRC